MSTEIYILRKLGGLSKLQGITTGFNVFEAQSTSEKEEGNPAGAYKGITFPNTEQELAVAWNDLSDSFCWGGELQDLNRIVNAKKLKYEKDHPQYGELITKADLYDFNDPFFRHSHWWNRRKALDGEILLRTDNIDDEFYILSYKGNPDCVDRSSEEEGVENLMGTSWELISVQKNESNKAKKTNQTLDVLVELHKSDTVTKEHIATIVGTSYDKADPETVIVGLVDLVNNPSKQKKFGGITGAERVGQLLELTKEQLILQSKVVQAQQLGLLKFNGNDFNFLTSDKRASSRIPASDIPQLVSWFLNNENQGDFLILEDELKNRLSK